MDDDIYPYVIDDEGVFNEPISIEEELERFRKQWRQELVDHRPVSGDTGQKDGSHTHGFVAEEPSIEEQAKYLFLQGVAAEQRSQLSDAIRYYRRAVQLVPDIEFRIDEFRPQRDRKERDRTISECSVESTGALTEEEEEDLSDLLLHFHKLHVTDGPLCTKHFDRPGTAFASLPAEVLNYILKWLVSSDLDVVSLESISQVCRGFYVASRDEELWRLVCQRIWGLNCGSASSYGNYRNMYYQRPHLRFNGCYITKTVYYRQGENSLNAFYKPFHMVEYYRYLRFYPEGHVLMLTTADDPFEIVQKLKKNCKIQGLLYGWYRLVGNLVSLVMKRNKVDYNQNVYNRYRRKNKKEEAEETEETFHVEFELENAGRRPQSKLLWKHYSRHVKHKLTLEESVADFDLESSDYPPMIFSRVKSYTSCSEKPLA